MGLSGRGLCHLHGELRLFAGIDSSPDLANLFLTCAKASGEASRLGGFRVRQGIGNMLTIGGTPYGKPMLATIERWDGFRSGSFGACFAFGQR